jgi:DNA-binding NtrC family response regulator
VTSTTRVIAATARAPHALALDARLRDALSVVIVELPPLRERAVDVPLLADAIVRRLGGDHPPALSDTAVERLARHSWPGNVPELRVILERAVARASAGVIAIDHLGLP